MYYDARQSLHKMTIKKKRKRNRQIEAPFFICYISIHPNLASPPLPTARINLACTGSTKQGTDKNLQKSLTSSHREGEE